MRLQTESNPPAFVDSRIVELHDEETLAAASNYLRQGIKAAQDGDRTAARAALLRSTEMDASSESAWLWLASMSEYPEELLVFLNNVLEINPLNARATEWMAATKSLLAKTFVQRGADASEAGQTDFAVSCFNQALENDQNNADAWFWMAKLADSDQGRLSYLEKVLGLDPENSDARDAYASAKLSINQSLLAEARMAAVNGRKDDANELLDAFIAENPESEDGWILRSHLADQFDQKVAAFEKILSFNPASPTARTGLDSLMAIMGSVSPETAFLPSNAPDSMESTAYVIDTEKQQLHDVVPDKNPTQDLEFPLAAVEFAEREDAKAREEQEVVYFEPVKEEEPVQFELPVEAPVAEDMTQFGSTGEQPAEEVVEAVAEAEPEAVHAEEFAAVPSPETEVSSNDWGMNTVAFTFAFPGGEQAEVVEPAVEVSNSEAFDFSVSPEAVPLSDNAADDALIETSSYESLESEPFVRTEVTEEFSFAPEEPAREFVPQFTEADFPVSVAHETEQNSVPLTEVFTVDPEMFADLSIPMPAGLDLPPVDVRTGFETTLFRSEPVNGSVLDNASCPFCRAENPVHAFTCSSCLSTLSLSDLEMMLANTHAEKSVVRTAVDALLAEYASRPLSEKELTNLGIGFLNLRDNQEGYRYLSEASQLNPNNVVLASQVNALLIRLDEIARQELAHDSMPKEKKILVVDDSATVRKLIAGKLEKCGHQVISAADGVEAIEQLDLMSPDLILLDITMPRMDGYQVCKVIRSKESTKDVPVVMISGKDGFFDKVRGRMAGTTGYITKPFGPETLMKAVETYLKGEEF